jgi:putative phosphoribosyl transferase
MAGVGFSAARPRAAPVVHEPFANRADAGRQLAPALRHLRHESVVVAGLPRGGVPVAYEVAVSLGAPLDVIVVRKLGDPSQPEYAVGAIGEDGVRIVDDEVVRSGRVSAEDLAVVEARERRELERRVDRFRGGRDHEPLERRTVVIVDDGVATGSTARAACQVARRLGAARIVLAVPVAPADWADRFTDVADELIRVVDLEPCHAIGQRYRDFTQTTDDEVATLLELARRHGHGPRSSIDSRSR